MTPNNRFVASAIAALALLLAYPASATLSRAVSFDQKVSEAQSIILGKCVATRAQWDSEHRFILTYATFRVEQTLKGDAPAEVTIVTPGGEVDGIRQESIGIPTFKEGDERVLFVKNTKAGQTVLYFDQGTYDVKTDDRGDKVIAPAPSAAVRIDTQSGRAVEPETARSLGEMKRQIHEASSRVETQRMEMIRARQRQASSTPLSRYWIFIAAAVVGAALATWQLLRR